jgi:uncharacterized protein (TIGR01777 family)
MQFLISGGSGFIGQSLVPRLLAAGHAVIVLTRDYAATRLRLGPEVTLVRELDELDGDTEIDVMINLAGAGIADRRWTRARKQVLLDSRLQTTRAMVQLVQRLSRRPQCFISGSAVGYYGASDGQVLSEQAAVVNDEFSHQLCRRWEEEALKMSALGVRTCVVRLGVVLGRGGGMLKRLAPPFRFGLGGRLGSGQQMLSWVHMDDVVAALEHLIQDASCEGIYNLTAPHPASNEKFTRSLARVLKRPAVLPMPAPMVWLLFGEMGDRLLLHGQAVVPSRLLEEGFVFSYPEIEPALRDCFANKG